MHHYFLIEAFMSYEMVEVERSACLYKIFTKNRCPKHPHYSASSHIYLRKISFPVLSPYDMSTASNSACPSSPQMDQTLWAVSFRGSSP